MPGDELFRAGVVVIIRRLGNGGGWHHGEARKENEHESKQIADLHGDHLIEEMGDGVGRRGYPEIWETKRRLWSLRSTTPYEFPNSR
jgi:hypothetical protein